MTAPVTITAEQYRVAQDRVTAQGIAQVYAVLRAIPSGTALSDNQWIRLMQLLFGGIVKAREEAKVLASAFYAGQSPTGTAPPLQQAFYNVDALDAALTRTSRVAITNKATHDKAAIDGAGAAGRHIEMAGRDYMRQATDNDGNALGWARVARGAKTCAFCMMLISRGPVYKTARSAGRDEFGNMTQWHDMCDCVAVPVFDENDWPGRDQYLKAEDLWAQNAGEGKDALNGFRRAIEEE